MGSSARLGALLAGCALLLPAWSCAINPQPEPPDQAQPGFGGGGGFPDAATSPDSGSAGAGGDYTGGSGGASNADADVGGTGASSGAAPPGAFDEGYNDNEDLGARLDAVNATGDAGIEDGGPDAADAGNVEADATPSD